MFSSFVRHLQNKREVAAALAIVGASSAVAVYLWRRSHRSVRSIGQSTSESILLQPEHPIPLSSLSKEEFWLSLLERVEEELASDTLSKPALTLLKDWIWPTNDATTGVPPNLRGLLWKTLARTSYIMKRHRAENVPSYLLFLERSETETLTGEAAHALEQIKLDMSRTMPEHTAFKGEDSPGQRYLLRVLRAFALFNPVVGYCQGMSYIVALFYLQELSEEDAFYLLVALTTERKYLLGYFTMQKIIREASPLFDRLLAHSLPQIHTHLQRIGCDNNLVYITQFFLTLFYVPLAPRLDSIQVCLDIFFAEGKPAVHRIILTLLYLCKDAILSCTSPETLLPKLLHPPDDIIAPKVLFPAAKFVQIHELLLQALEEGIDNHSASKPIPHSAPASPVQRQAMESRISTDAKRAHSTQY